MTYVPAVETIVPPGRVVVAPLQIEMFLEEEVFGMTVKFVVIVESQPAELAICEMYVPAFEITIPSGSVELAPLQIEMFLEEEEFGMTVKFVVIVESQPAAFGI